MACPHSITYRGPLRYEGHFVAALRDEALDLDGFLPHPHSDAEAGVDVPHAVSLTAEGPFRSVERACRRFVRLWPAVEVELNGERVQPEEDRHW